MRGECVALRPDERDVDGVKQSYPLPQHAHGISVDFNGYVWAVTQGTEAYRLDPADGSFEVVKGLVGAYTYSDMTGFALSAVHVP